MTLRMTKERRTLLIGDMQHITGMDGGEQIGRHLSSLDSAAIKKKKKKEGEEKENEEEEEQEEEKKK
jgi:hypothetical protein